MCNKLVFAGVNVVLRYAHLLEGDRILLGLVDSQGNISIFLDKLSRIDGAIRSKSHAKLFHQDKIGPTCLFAFDESKCMLAVYASARVCYCVSGSVEAILTTLLRCNSMCSYLMKSSSPYGDWEQQ